jgi:hypothetical protein
MKVTFYDGNTTAISKTRAKFEKRGDSHLGLSLYTTKNYRYSLWLKTRQNFEKGDRVDSPEA